jgi:hypothetical protein
MWEDYRVNGADFSVGDDVEDQQKQRRRLQEEADVFGLWNPDATARLLGFGGEDARDQVQEDELAEIMRNVGEFCYLKVDDRDETDESLMDCVCGRMDYCPGFWHRSVAQMVCGMNQCEAREGGSDAMVRVWSHVSFDHGIAESGLDARCTILPRGQCAKPPTARKERYIHIY